MTPEPQTTNPSAPDRAATREAGLVALVGARGSALADLYRKGTSFDPSRVQDPLRGRFLASAVFPSADYALRQVIRFVSASLMPWEGLVFDHGGNAGANLVLGKKALRFRAERGPSLVDGASTLVMTYDKSPWPATLLRDELRTIGHGLAIGPTYFRVAGVDKLVGWFGLTGDF